MKGSTITLLVLVIALVILLLLAFIISQGSRIVHSVIGSITGTSNNARLSKQALVVFPNQNGTINLPSEGKNIRVEANPSKSLTIKVVPGVTQGREITIINTSKLPNTKIKLSGGIGVTLPTKTLLPGETVKYTAIRDNVYLII